MGLGRGMGDVEGLAESRERGGGMARKKLRMVSGGAYSIRRQPNKERMFLFDEMGIVVKSAILLLLHRLFTPTFLSSCSLQSFRVLCSSL